MKLSWNCRRLACLLGVGVGIPAVILVARAFAADKPPAPKPPNPQPPANARADHRKEQIETPTKRILAKRTNPAGIPDAGAFVNPKVEPGKVRWHKDFATACREAKKSSKPVLLFQMMGKLDDQFC
jgi:hypothetical protein